MKHFTESEAWVFSEMLRDRWGVSLVDAIPIARGSKVICAHGLPLSMLPPGQATELELCDQAYNTRSGRVLAYVGRCSECGRVFYRPNFFN